ncbi:hypothetical protein FACS189426_21660 [Bacteroidia bacterium]|nr:hypothetical protein FACS189426_21660 [Bacteroidia bacterium]
MKRKVGSIENFKAEVMNTGAYGMGQLDVFKDIDSYFLGISIRMFFDEYNPPAPYPYFGYTL